MVAVTPGLGSPSNMASTSSSDTSSEVPGPVFSRPAFAPPTGGAIAVPAPQAPSPSQLIHSIHFDSTANHNESLNNSFVPEPEEVQVHRLKDVADAIFR